MTDIDDETRQRLAESIQAGFDMMEDHCTPHSNETRFPRHIFRWTAKGIGFGEFTIYHGDDGELRIDNEAMSREFIKRMFCQMIDECELDYPEPKK